MALVPALVEVALTSFIPLRDQALQSRFAYVSANRFGSLDHYFDPNEIREQLVVGGSDLQVSVYVPQDGFFLACWGHPGDQPTSVSFGKMRLHTGQRQAYREKVGGHVVATSSTYHFSTGGEGGLALQTNGDITDDGTYDEYDLSHTGEEPFGPPVIRDRLSEVEERVMVAEGVYGVLYERLMARLELATGLAGRPELWG